jgi:predicted transcriptional regulator
VSTTIRVSDEAKRRIAAIARQTGRPMTELLDDALEALERRIFFEAFNERYNQLRSDAGAWAEIEAERRIEEGSIADNL